MKLTDKYAAERRVRRCARPIEIKVGNNRAVLCIHGFTGYPGEMAYPAEELSKGGWDVFVPRLSGHGTDGRDFSTRNFRDWRNQISDEWLNLRSRYQTVAVCGHSMGGLLALDLASRYDVASCVVYAPAIGLRFRGWRFLGPLSRISPRKPYDWKPDPEYTFYDERDDDDDAFLGKEYWSWIWLKPLSELMRLQHELVSRLKQIKAPVLGVYAENDKVVGQGGHQLLEKGLSAQYRSVILKDCGHYIPYDPNPGTKEKAMTETLNWLESASKHSSDEI